MTTAVCPGSFDPVTKGHLDIIKRACTLFDRVVVLIADNPAKNPVFTVSERAEMVKRVTKDINNVEVDTDDGLLADYAKKIGAKIVVKGLRAMTDFEYEFQMALTNKMLNPDMETLFITTNSDYMYLSSSIVKQIASFGGDISQFIPAEILDDITKKLCERSR